jgi:putative oxidoreductase
MKPLFVPHPADLRQSLALLLVRLVAGAGILMHGLPKLDDPLGWMGPTATVPAVLQALAVLSEVGGGAAWVLGLLTPLASLGVACTMGVATWTHMSRGDPFVGRGGSWELAALYLSIALLLLLAGPGRLSADQVLFRPPRSLFGNPKSMRG